MTLAYNSSLFVPRPGNDPTLLCRNRRRDFIFTGKGPFTNSSSPSVARLRCGSYTTSHERLQGGIRYDGLATFKLAKREACATSPTEVSNNGS